MLDLGQLFRPDTPLLEIFVRGTLTYLVLFAILRLTLNRSSSTVGMTDATSTASSSATRS